MTAHHEHRPVASPPPLGFWMCLALVIGNIVGSGVYLLPASLAPYGLNSIFGWIITSGGAIALGRRVCAAWRRCFRKLAGRMFMRASRSAMALDSSWPGVIGWAFGLATPPLRSRPSRISPSWCRGSKSHRGAPAIASCVIIWLLTYVNWRGTRQMGGAADRHHRAEVTAAGCHHRARVVAADDGGCVGHQSGAEPFSIDRDQCVGDADVVGLPGTGVGHGAGRQGR